MVARAEARRQRWATLAVAAVVALGLGASLAAFAAAYRTDHAYPDYVRRAEVTDLVVNPQLPTQEFADRLDEVPHVRHVWTQDLLIAGVMEWHPMTAAEAARTGDVGEGIGSVDGRYDSADRPMISEGRAPTGAREVFVTESFRPVLDKIMKHPVHVGDLIPIVFLYPGDVDPDASLAFDPNRQIDPIGQEKLRVSGFGRLPDEVFDDDLYPRQRFIVSPDVARKYSCGATIPNASLEEVVAAAYPPDCARTYRYYAIDVDDSANVRAVTRSIKAITDDLNQGLPPELLETGTSYFPLLTTQSDLDAQVAHSVEPTVVAFVLFGVLAGVATLLLAILGCARIVRLARQTNETIHSLGLSRPSRALAVAMPSGIAVAFGVILAVILGYLFSTAGPSGEVRRAASDSSFSLPAAVALPVIGGFAVVCATALALVAMSSVRMATARPAASSILRGPTVPTANPALADGVRNGLSAHRGGVLLTAACAVAVATLVGAGMFGANLTALVDKPTRYGWPWDAAVLTAGGYGGTAVDTVANDLRARDDVASYNLMGFASATAKGRGLLILVSSRDAPPVDLPIVAGRAPRDVDEVALGTVTAERLGLEIGDEAEFDIRGATVRARVVGTTVLPAVGPLFTDRSGLGIGGFAVAPPEELDDGFVTFIGIRMKPGADGARLLRELDPVLINWDHTRSVPDSYATPVRPPEIVNAEDMRRGPLILAGALAAASLAALALAIAATVNARRRDFAIYRAMGFTPRQVASSVRWQALTTVVVGVALGIPAGILIGRWTWRRYADALGITLDVTTPLLMLGAIAVVAVIAALVAAARPARVASRLRPAEILHTQ